MFLTIVTFLRISDLRRGREVKVILDNAWMVVLDAEVTKKISKSTQYLFDLFLFIASVYI